MDDKIKELFNQFAGREISTVPYYPGVPISMQNPVVPNPEDPVLKQIERVASENGLKFRALLDPVCQADLRHDRVNVEVEEYREGKYKINVGFF